MNAKEFVERINDYGWNFTRTCLATGHVTDDEIVTPREPISANGRSSIILKDIHSYEDEDCLFTEDRGAIVAVVLTGAGHLYCDRFTPIQKSSRKPVAMADES